MVSQWGASASTARFVGCLICVPWWLDKPLSLCIGNLVVLLMVKFVIDIEALVKTTLLPWEASSVSLIYIYSSTCIDWFIPSLAVRFSADIHCSAAIAHAFSASHFTAKFSSVIWPSASACSCALLFINAFVCPFWLQRKLTL